MNVQTQGLKEELLRTDEEFHQLVAKHHELEDRLTQPFENDLFCHQGFGEISSGDGLLNQRTIPLQGGQQGAGAQEAWGQPGNVPLKDERMISLLPGLA